jgi:hypothetical protein
MVVAGEKSLAEDGREQAQQPTDNQDTLQRAVYCSSPFSRICSYNRT